MGECTLDLSSCVVVAALAVVLHFWRDGLRQCRSAVGPDSIGPILVLLEALDKAKEFAAPSAGREPGIGYKARAWPFPVSHPHSILFSTACRG